MGFISGNRLKMSGGELCINATLAFASILGNCGKLYTSGIKEVVKYENKNNITSIKFSLKYKKDRNIVLFEGIGFVCAKKLKINKELLSNYCDKYKLPAFGIVIYKKNRITPYVYVKSVGSFFKETACGSGSVAYSIYSGYKKIIQPTKEMIKVNIKKDKVLVSAEVKKWKL